MTTAIESSMAVVSEKYMGHRRSTNITIAIGYSYIYEDLVSTVAKRKSHISYAGFVAS